jgi:hypothetical protein
MVKYVFCNDMFHNFATDTSERDWSVIYCVVFFTFFCMLMQHLHVPSQMVRSQSDVIFEK